MGKYNGAVITTAGQNIIAESISGTLLEWTVMRSSSVAIPAGTNLEALTSLTGIEQSTHITDASVYGNNVLQVSARFSNTGVSTAYLIQTVGIYGQLTGGSETLIAVMTAVTPDEMPVYDPDSPSAFIYNTQVTVQNADSVTMVVNDTGTASVADLNRKVDISGGDVSDTVVNTVVAESAEYPVPAAGDTVKVIIGKIAKFFADIVRPFTGATDSANGAKGLVPSPSVGQHTAYMRGDGSWVQSKNNNTTTQAGYVLDARMGKTLHEEVTALSESLERTGDTVAVRFNTNATGDGMSLRYVRPNSDMYVFRLFGTVGGNHFDFVKMDSAGNITETYFSSSRKKVTSICGGGVLTYMDRVCILDYQSASYVSSGNAIPVDLRPDTLTFACASISGDTTPYRLGVRTDGTVVLQDYLNAAKTTASNVRGQVMWILSNT